MKLTFYGAAETVTGSQYLLETSQGKMLIDCGMFQGNKELRDRNYLDFEYNPQDISCVIVTHAHIDHSGLLPKLVKHGFNGKIFVARPTEELLEILLKDSAHIEEMDIKRENKWLKRNGQKERKPLFTTEDAEKTLKMIETVEYHEEFSPLSNIKAQYKDAGHIMGSGFVELEIEENNITKKIIFSGDIGRSFQAFIRNPEVSQKADLILIESTYGNRNHKSDSDTANELVSILKQIVQSKGTLIIPSFAVGRTQEMIYQFFELSLRNNIPPIKIYIDSPMGDKVTQVYSQNKDLYDKKTLEYLKNGKTPIDLSLFKFTKSVDDSKKLNNTPGPKVIISASGMCEGGRVVHHLKHNLWKPNTHILFVGYQARGTIGRRIIEGAKRVKILGDSINVNAQIHTVGNLSAHADKDGLLSWLHFYQKSNPQIFVVHGESDVCPIFADTIANKYGFVSYVPKWRDTATINLKKESIDINFKHKEEKTDYISQKEKLFNNISSTKEILTKLESKKDFTKQSTDFMKNLNNEIEILLEQIKTDTQDK